MGSGRFSLLQCMEFLSLVLFISAARIARSFRLGTDQIRCNLSMITFWEILSLTIGYCWQLYTLWLWVQLHEAVPEKRYNRYVELAQAVFGERLKVCLALFPTVYLPVGIATALILIEGETMKLFFQIVCGPTCTSNSLTTVEWYLIFTSLSIVLSQLPNLNSIAGLSLIGVVTAITYSTMVWVLSVSQ
ncbi:lysine histidine transporter-like 8 [Arachis hypogaea]|uniref:lysine histidine transporter-like 8 n=1 Tax=Arachis hypogaea TaxID=3818 RepID=UPI003B21AC37